MNILIPMAGANQRFKAAGFEDPKPLIDISGKPMIQCAVESLGVDGQFIFVINPNNGKVKELKELLCKITLDPIIIEVDYLTQGPASTCLLAKQHIDNDEPLLIANCDQIMEWNAQMFKATISKFKHDGMVVTYYAGTNKNSYVRIDETGVAVEFAEKKVISNYSLNGIHFWKKGKDFVFSAERMIANDIRTNGEFYISTTYNELIKEGKVVVIYHIPEKQHWAVGTPEDLRIYLEGHNGHT